MKVYIAVFAAMALAAVNSGFSFHRKSFSSLRQTGGPLPLDSLTENGRRAFLGYMTGYAGKLGMQDFYNGITSALYNEADNDYVIQKLCWKFVPWSYALLNGTDNAQFVAGVEAKANISDEIECAGQLLHEEYWAKKFGTGFPAYLAGDTRFNGIHGLCLNASTLLNKLDAPFADVDESSGNTRQLRKLDDVLKQLQKLLQK